MKTRIWLILAGAALALTAVLVLPSFSAARASDQAAGYGQSTGRMMGQANGPGSARQRGQGMMGGQQMGGQQMGGQQSLLAVAAQVLGITQDELMTQLQPDKSIADVAGDKTQAVIDSFVQQQSEHINAMVSAGNLTQADADQQLAVMKGMITGRVYQSWATGVKGPPEGMQDAMGAGHVQGNGQGAGMGRA